MKAEGAESARRRQTAMATTRATATDSTSHKEFLAHISCHAGAIEELMADKDSNSKRIVSVEEIS
jgi:hypothetical protein